MNSGRRMSFVLALLGVIVSASDPGLAFARQSFDFRSYLLQRNDLGESLKRECGDTELITNLQVRYADLIGKGDKQAIVEATTCMMGNGGADIVEVFRMPPGHDPVSLTIDDSGYPGGQQALYAGETRTPRLTVRNGKLVRWFTRYRSSPAGEAPVPAGTRVITYCWRKDRFLICNVTDQAAGTIDAKPRTGAGSH